MWRTEVNAKCDDCGYEGPDFVESIDHMLTCPNCGADDVTTPDVADTESSEPVEDVD